MKLNNKKDATSKSKMTKDKKKQPDVFPSKVPKTETNDYEAAEELGFTELISK